MAETLGVIPVRNRVFEIKRAYAKMEQEIINALRKVDIASYRELNSIRVQKMLEDSIDRLNRFIPKWGKPAVTDAYDTSAGKARTALSILGAKENIYFDKGVHEQSKAEYYDAMLEDFLRANATIKKTIGMYFYLVRRSNAGLKELQMFDFQDEIMIDSIIQETFEMGLPYTSAQNQIETYLRTKLLDGKFIQVGERFYNLRAYSEMVARTRLRQTQTRATKNYCRQYQNDLMQFSQHAEPCEICLPLENQIYSLSGKHPTYPPLTSDVEPPIHPRCEHNLNPTSERAISWRQAFDYHGGMI